MRARVASSLWIRRHEGRRREVFRRGQVIDASREEIAASGGYLIPADTAGELPPPNAPSVDERATKPDGQPLEVKAGPPAVEETGELEEPKSHADADALAKRLGISFPAGKGRPTVAQKWEAIQAVAAAQAAAGPAAAVSTDDLSERSDAELLQMGVDAGHAEAEMVLLSHDELVRFVAEAVNRRSGGDPSREPGE